MSVAAASAALLRVVLHGGPHSATSSGGVQFEYLVASTLFVGSVGVALYWYYGRRAETR